MFARDHTRICSRPFARIDASIHAYGRHQPAKNFEKTGKTQQETVQSVRSVEKEKLNGCHR